MATVIIKDQSRIGRDVVEVGLLKRTFDEYHVRFIAANDNLDTANGFDIMSIFRDVINEWYVADTSRKIKTVFKPRMVRNPGKRIRQPVIHITTNANDYGIPTHSSYFYQIYKLYSCFLDFCFNLSDIVLNYHFR